jgi:hypothetical protein
MQKFGIPSAASNLLYTKVCHSERSEGATYKSLSFRAKRGICFLAADGADSLPAEAGSEWNASAWSQPGSAHWSGKTSLKRSCCKRKGASREACALIYLYI